MSVLPNQLPGLADSLGLSRQEVDGAVWAVEASGRRWRGAAAINRVLSEFGGGWALLAFPYRLRPVAWLEDRAYAWLVRNRARFHRLGITPECEEPGVDCE